MQKTIDNTKLSNYNLILAFLVVLIHTENIAEFDSLANGSSYSHFVMLFQWLFSKNIALAAVPSFFMISGILFYRDFTIDKYPQKLKSRFFSLIIPFLAWNFLRFAFFYLLGKLRITDSLLHVPRTVFTWENFFEGVFFYKYNQGFWFMYQLVLFTLLAPIIRLLVKNKWVGLTVITGLIVLYSTDLVGPFLVTTLDRKFILLDSFIYYIIGAYVSTHFFDVVNKKTRTTKCLAIVGVVIAQLIFMLFSGDQKLIYYIMFLLISSVSFWYLFDWFKVKPPAKCLTGITFFIYAAHGTILEFLHFAATLIGDTATIALLSYILMPIITMAIIICVSLLMKKYTAPLWKILCGAR